MPAARVHVVPNGIEAVRFRFDEGVRRTTRARTGLPERAFVVGGVGRLVPGKRFDVLVRAVAALPGAHLLLAGDGPERAGLRRLAAELGAQSRIHLLGERDPLGDSADGRTPAFRRCWPPWTSSSRRRGRRPSGSRSSRPWPPGFRSCT